MKGFTLWFTGMPGSGKTTLSRAVEDILLERGLKVELLDGDRVRENLSKGLGFSKEDRDTNIRRIGFVCRLLTRNEVVAIAAAISPYKAVREENRNLIGRYVEVFCKCDLEALKKRDAKGLYAAAERGEIKGVTGVDDPYEEPDGAEVVCDTAKESVEESVRSIIRTLELLEFIPPVDQGEDYSREEEDKIKERLKALGYI